MRKVNQFNQGKFTLEVDNFLKVVNPCNKPYSNIMAKALTPLLIPYEQALNKIYLIRRQKVMLDRGLAELYQVETKRLKEAVRRNIDRFPDDFMFEMTAEELQNWRTQIASSNSEMMGLRYLPFCFTEQGVAMLSSVLNSEIAIHVNIQIIRIFTKMRQVILQHKDILLQLEKIENKLTKHDEGIVLIFQYLKQLLHPPQIPRPKVGFRRNNQKE